MIQKVLFIDDIYIGDNTPVDINVEGTTISPAINISQDKYIQPILGTLFYNALVWSGNAWTTDEIYLIERYIAPALCWWTYYELLPNILTKPTNATLAEKDSTVSQPTSVKTMQFLQNSARENAQLYSDALKNYLCENYQLFPNYTLTDNKPDTQTQKQNGMFFQTNPIIGYSYSRDRWLW